MLTYLRMSYKPAGLEATGPTAKPFFVRTSLCPLKYRVNKRNMGQSQHKDHKMYIFRTLRESMMNVVLKDFSIITELNYSVQAGLAHHSKKLLVHSKPFINPASLSL